MQNLVRVWLAWRREAALAEAEYEVERAKVEREMLLLRHEVRVRRAAVRALYAAHDRWHGLGWQW